MYKNCLREQRNGFTTTCIKTESYTYSTKTFFLVTERSLQRKINFMSQHNPMKIHLHILDANLETIKCCFTVVMSHTCIKWKFSFQIKLKSWSQIGERCCHTFLLSHAYCNKKSKQQAKRDIAKHLSQLSLALTCPFSFTVNISVVMMQC